ncbi:uncharacterized protein DSM5745_08662 [Aspergillus mulundensis]|uniref:Uncharacterized protein n=1 Tax=Aspergillus mulundensis TaxID=1810919 RepID=A0A3D8R4B4_9EURO|nr:hypothetical protein DSM5745_08662 [Aspergillus mulundensis]RDW68902.1 hypothetical protein DSM5745_08662 [Aspergillus mulundensis]
MRLRADNARSQRTGAPDYDDPSFWDRKFATGQDVGEWLNAGEILLDALISFLETRSAAEAAKAAPRVLHLGPGISKLGGRVRDAFVARGWRGSGIVNADFSSEAVRLGRDGERTQDTAHAMHWVQTDLRLWLDVSKLGPLGPFDAIIDKSTSDAIATSTPVTLNTDPSEPSSVCPIIQDTFTNAKESDGDGEITLSSVELLGLHLVPLTKKGSRWFVLSYSAFRFEDVPWLFEYWEVVARMPIEAPGGLTASGAKAPAVYHWVYTLQRRRPSPLFLFFSKPNSDILFLILAQGSKLDRCVSLNKDRRRNLPGLCPFTTGLRGETEVEKISGLIEFAKFLDMVGVTQAEASVAEDIKSVIADASSNLYSSDNDRNVRHVLSEHLYSASDLPPGHPVRHILATAAVENFLLFETFKFRAEIRDLPGFTGDLLEVLRSPLFTVKLKDYSSLQGQSVSLLYAATQEGYEAAAKVLLNAGANPSIRYAPESWTDTTPLLNTVAGGNLEIIRLLIAHGASVHEHDGVARTPLDVAVRMNYVKAHGGDKDLPWTLASGLTLLYGAAARGQVEAVRLLLDAGADPNAQVSLHMDCSDNSTSHTRPAPLLVLQAVAEARFGSATLWVRNFAGKAGTSFLLCRKEQWRPGERETYAEILGLLIPAGTDVTSVHQGSGSMPLRLAAATGNQAAVEVLIQGNVDAFAKLANGVDALYIAMGCGYHGIVRFWRMRWKRERSQPTSNGSGAMEDGCLEHRR